MFSAAILLQTLQNFPQPSCYWVAFSGGIDSTCLLQAMVQLRQQLSVPVRALHLDHGLQSESSLLAQHCQQVCAKLNIELRTLALGLTPVPGESLEAVSRQARLTAFKNILNTNEMLLTAQHQNDQAETLLLQLLRGSGLAGLAGMPGFIAYASGWLARPLLDVTRAQLYAYAQTNHLKWVEDPSNAATNFDRNYLRQRILPLVAQRWPAYGATVSRSASHCAEALGLIDDLLIPHLVKSRGSRLGTLSITALQSLKPSLCRAILRHWIREQGHLMPDRQRLERIRCELMPAASDRSPLVAWSGTEVRRYRDDIFLLTPLPPLPAAEPIRWSSGQTCDLPNSLGNLRQIQTQEAGIDPVSWSQGNIEIRFGIKGLQCQPAKMAHKRRLKDIYQQHGIPDWLRPYVPLVYLDGELIAVAGICLCHQHTKIVARQGIKIIWDRSSPPFQWLINSQQFSF